MTQPIPTTALQLRSLVRSSGELEVSLHEVPVPEPGADEVLVRTILQHQDATQLLVRLRTVFAGAGLVYWIMPVMEFGALDDGGDQVES